MPKFDDTFLSYYEQEHASLLQQLEHLQSGKLKVLDNSVDITAKCIEDTERKLAALEAIADKLAGG